MAPQVKKHLSNIEIDEISLVDRGANQHAAVTIAKRAPEEENMPEFYSEDGELLPEDTVLNEGDVIYDGEGQAYEYVLEDEDDNEEEYEEEPEMAGVGKAFSVSPGGSATKLGSDIVRRGKAGGKGKAHEFKSGFKGYTDMGASRANRTGAHLGSNKGKYAAGAGGTTLAGAGGVAAAKNREDSVGLGKSFREEVMEELSKAYTDAERDEVIAKAFDQVETYSKQAEEAEEIAKAERDLRLTREYVSKAAEYNVPVDPNELGPVLYRMAETMDYDDCATIHKALESAGAALFDEVGHIGGGDNADVMSQVSAYVGEQVSKSADLDPYSEVAKAFDMNPEAYDQYLAEQRGF